MKEIEELECLMKKLKIALQLLNCYTNKSVINHLILTKLKSSGEENIGFQTREEKVKILEIIQAIDEGKLETVQQALTDKSSLFYKLSLTPNNQIGNLLADYLNWENERQILTSLVDIENSINIYNLNKNLASLKKIKSNFQKVKLLFRENYHVSTISWTSYKRVRQLLNKFVPGCQQKNYSRKSNLISKKLKKGTIKV